LAAGSPAGDGRPFDALLLDYGGVVSRSTFELLPQLAGRHPQVAGALRRRGPLGAEHDELWDRMMAREITEREYWSRRAAEFGRAFGADWDVRDLMAWLEDGEISEAERIRPQAAELVADAQSAGVLVGVLSNDLAAFHDDDWLDRQQVLKQVDVVVDGSVTGVLKPDPRIYLTAADRLGTAPERVVFIDDIAWNVAGAQAVGMTACLLDLAEPGAAFGLARKGLGLPARPS
jgi:putative hydrolase of the HAD superfamily